MYRNIRCDVFFCVYGVYGVGTKQAEVVLWQLDKRRAEKLNLAFVADLVDLMVNHKCYVVCMSRAHMSASVSKGS